MKRKPPEVFKPEDFKDAQLAPIYAQCVAYIANHLLAERGTVVYGTKYKSNKGWAFDEQGILPSETTHTALLLDIQPIAEDTIDDLPIVKLKDEVKTTPHEPFVDIVHDLANLTPAFSIEEVMSLIERACNLVNEQDDTAEDILRDLVYSVGIGTNPFLDRARAYLAKKEGK